MEVELDPNTSPLTENDEDSSSEESTILNITANKGLRIFELLHKDQLDGKKSLADTHIVCEDGHVPFHRYILMAASSLMQDLLENEDPSELTVIHIPDVKVANVAHALSILYSGKTFYTKSDEGNIYKIFQILGVSTDGLQFRKSKPEDGTILGKLRFYEKTIESEKEDFIPNIIQISSPEIPVIEANVENESAAGLIGNDIVQYQEVKEARATRVVSESQIANVENVSDAGLMGNDIVQYQEVEEARARRIFFESQIANVENEIDAGLIGNDIVQYQEVMEAQEPRVVSESQIANVENEIDAGLFGNDIVQYQEVKEAQEPRVVSESQIDRAETAKLISRELLEGDDAIIETGCKIKCRYCNSIYTSEESLSEHLSSSCGSHLIGKYSYANKQCLGCRGRYPSYNLYGLINHVELCKRLKVGVSATASQFVNGNLPPVSVQEENVDQLDVMGDKIFTPGLKSVEKESTNEEPKPQGRKRGKNYGKKREHDDGKRKASIQIVNVRELGETKEVVENVNGNGQQIEMEAMDEEQHIHETEKEEDDVIFEEIIHPPNSKTRRCEPSSSSAAGSSSEVMNSGKIAVIQEQEENVDQLDKMEDKIFTHGLKSVEKVSTNEGPKTKGRKRGKKCGKEREHSGGKRKTAIQIVDVRKLGEMNEVVENINGNGQQIEMQVINKEQHIHETKEKDDDIIFEEIIHPPNSKKPRCEPSSSSAAGCSRELMNSGKPAVIQNQKDQEENVNEIENDPSGSCKDISTMPAQDLKLLCTACPVCNKRYTESKTVSKCLQTHKLRRCWICLKLVAFNTYDFWKHSLEHRITGTEGKVSCSFCGKQCGYNLGMITHMEMYHFPRFLKTTTADLNKNIRLSSKEIKTLEIYNRGLSNGKDSNISSAIATPSNHNEQCTSSNGQIVEKIAISEESYECVTISSDEDDAAFVPPARKEFIDHIPKSKKSLLAKKKRSSVSSTVTSATMKASPPTPPTFKPPNLGRVLLERKEIDGQIYNIYGLVNSTSTDPKNKLSKVIAIRSTDVETSSTKKLDKLGNK